jgi:hypothetical protein
MRLGNHVIRVHEQSQACFRRKKQSRLELGVAQPSILAGGRSGLRMHMRAMESVSLCTHADEKLMRFWKLEAAIRVSGQTLRNN